MVEPTIHVRGGVRIYGIPGVPNNFPSLYSFRGSNLGTCHLGKLLGTLGVP